MEPETYQFDGLRVWVSGAPDGEPVLLSAGLGGHGDYWSKQIADLNPFFRVIIYDHRGTGQSDRTIPKAYRVAHMAHDIAVILDGLKIAAAHVVGHAAGALAGLQLALDAPQKVRSLTCVNGWAVADAHLAYCFETRRKIYEAGGAEAYLKAQPLFLYPSEWICDHLDHLMAQAVRHAPTFQAPATLFARIKALCQFDIQTQLSNITCPTLVLSASDDLLVTPRSSQMLTDNLPNAQAVVLPLGGHGVNVTAPEAFNQHLITFLNAVSASSPTRKV